MPVLMILVIIGLLILWFLLSPFFTEIGSFVYKIIKNSVTEEIFFSLFSVKIHYFTEVT